MDYSCKFAGSWKTGTEKERTPAEDAKLLDSDSGVVLRRDELGKVDFGQMLVWVRRGEVEDDGTIGQVKLLYYGGRVTDAVDTGVTATVIVGGLNRATGAMIGSGEL